MYPILLKISNFNLYSLGVLLAIGFFVAFFIIWRRLREVGLEEDKIIDGFLFSCLTSIFLSRVFYLVNNFNHFGFSPFKWLFLNRFPGLSFWGALAGFLIGFWYFCQREKWEFFKIADELVFGLVPFSIFTHLGMFLDGSNLGDETGMFWGFFFPGDMVRRQPVSLFLAIFFLAFEIFFLRNEKIWRSWDWYKSHKQGFLVLIFLILASSSTFLLAFFKPKGLYSVLVEKIASLLVFGLTIGVLYYRSGRKFKEDFYFFKKIKISQKHKNGQKNH